MTWDQRNIRKLGWHKWFAWRPVRDRAKYRWIWWEGVLRHRYLTAYGWRWEYRLSEE